jgi:hypothetical protein
MREWLLVLIPVVIVIYFVIYPDQLSALSQWAAGLLR